MPVREVLVFNLLAACAEIGLLNTQVVSYNDSSERSMIDSRLLVGAISTRNEAIYCMSSPSGPYHTFSFRGEEITWAGDCPWTDKYCFGTASGKLLFHIPDEANELGSSTEFQVSSKPINEVAFWKNLVAVATRGEVSVHRGPLSVAELSRVAGWQGGAHRIVATPRGRLLAPMGNAGLLFLDCEQLSSDPVGVDLVDEKACNYQKVIFLGELDGNEIVAGAARTDGLVRITVESADRHRVVSLNAPRVDLVDVCQLRSADWPFAIAALDVDRSLVLVRDIMALSDRSPVRVKLQGLHGTPCSVFHALGHILVSTTKELAVYADLSARFLAGDPLEVPTVVYYLAMEGGRAYIAGDRQLMVVLEEGVRVSEILPIDPAENGRGSRLSKVKVLNWNTTRETLRVVPTSWATRVA